MRSCGTVAQQVLNRNGLGSVQWHLSCLLELEDDVQHVAQQQKGERTKQHRVWAAQDAHLQQRQGTRTESGKDTNGGVVTQEPELKCLLGFVGRRCNCILYCDTAAPCTAALHGMLDR